ncbi:MAG: RelA/SpoT AH/RIS domain-containing protein, partial [Gluconobacter cerinus]
AIAKAFRQEGVDGSEKVLDGILKELRQSSIEDLYVAVGNGQLGPKDVVNTAYPDLRQNGRAPRMVPGLSPRFGQSLLLGAGSGPARQSPVVQSTNILKGIGTGIATSFAGCCRPLPGDPIVGIIAQSKGVTIHRRGCQNLSSFADTPERFIEVDWDYEALGRRKDAVPYTARLSVIAANEPEVLATLTNTAAKYNGSVINLKIVNRQLDFMEILVDLEVRDLRHLSSLIAAFRTAVGVMQVERAKG